ncbi:MAG TPA: efflux RND transporter periplasmic adaptor subunit, partial [Methylomirabilota bacterium]|nr:efflux RND transporter periplasmic adaptor subunit [Methylomirabilota bacterium]
GGGRPPGSAGPTSSVGGPASAGRGAGPRGRVWIVGPDGKPKQVAVQLGVSDGTNTEIVGGDVAEGQQVIVGLGERAPAGGGTSGGPRLRF